MLDHFERIMIPGPAGNPIPLVGLLFGAFKAGWGLSGEGWNNEWNDCKPSEEEYLAEEFREWARSGP